MYEKDYSELMDFIATEFPKEIGKGDKKRGESAAQVAMRLLMNYKSLSAPSYTQIIDLEKEKKKLIERMDVLSSEIQSIDYQISSAILKKMETGEYSDPSWFMSAKNAKKAKRAEIIRIQRRLHQLNSKIKACRSRTYERIFMESAKEVLPSDQYATICKIAFDSLGKIEHFIEG